MPRVREELQFVAVKAVPVIGQQMEERDAGGDTE
jgi:hypothetical protein